MNCIPKITSQELQVVRRILAAPRMNKVDALGRELNLALGHT